jgi:hypothetical protein
VLLQIGLLPKIGRNNIIGSAFAALGMLRRRRARLLKHHPFTLNLIPAKVTRKWESRFKSEDEALRFYQWRNFAPRLAQLSSLPIWELPRKRAKTMPPYSRVGSKS